MGVALWHTPLIHRRCDVPAYKNHRLLHGLCTALLGQWLQRHEELFGTYVGPDS